MVTSQHETSHRIFQERPGLLSPVFRILGVSLPEEAAVEVLTGDVTEIRPLERRVDSVLRIRPPDGGDGFLLAIEAQGRRAEDKPVSWAYYLSFLMAKYSCPALLLVVCQDKATAGWAVGPFPLGHAEWTSLSVQPLVLGPGNLPIILDVEEAAQDLTLAAFSALTHGRHPDATAILETLAQALYTVDRETSKYYWEMLEIGLGDTRAREIWRKLMNVRTYFPGRGTLIEETYDKGLAEGREKGLAEGCAEGRLRERAQQVLRILAHRELDVPDAVRERVSGCADLDTLGLWLDRAFTVTRAEDLFDERS
ncbi:MULTISPECIES: RpnC/YadD family protein [Streptomyces]|uniref:hypothetical protein n=1 Tax=Streptomyces TaxID=1883 RepID=UPI00163BE512|nr:MULTISPECIES: hypothetical protein [Streptomyces]MBC2874985.1 hypothetical protein [Streptomyces sp. TYQ1024]UBI37422.1 hypothetical protein K7I03_13745 [Streptomyces mobaraensis]UKW30013.1 hypothetical protein MCU78_13710 [Streptomyces sp. TYQ1024]